MGWHLTDDPVVWAEHVLPVLRQDPVGATVGLSVLGRLLGGHGEGTPSALLWHDDGGAVSLTPPGELVLSRVPAGTEADLARALRAHSFPALHGEPATTSAVALALGRPHHLAMVQPLYRLERLLPPADPGGRARPAGEADLDVVVPWWGQFMAVAAPGHPGAREEHAAAVRERMARGRVVLWEVDGRPVAMAGRTAVDEGVSRIGGVWTPPPHRGRGLAAAVTAACAQDALDAGAAHVVLFTDGDNPTTNALYPRIGFRRVGERHVVALS